MNTVIALGEKLANYLGMLFSGKVHASQCITLNPQHDGVEDTNYIYFQYWNHYYLKNIAENLLNRTVIQRCYICLPYITFKYY